MSRESALLVVLRAEIRADRAALSAQAQRIRKALAMEVWLADDAVLAVVAVALHHYYGAAESIFERVAKAFEGMPAQNDRWHRDLLDRMALDLPGVRPALLGNASHRGLAEVLAFRHFFRHAYAVALDPAQLRSRAADLIRVDMAFAVDLDRFEALLAEGARPDG